MPGLTLRFSAGAPAAELVPSFRRAQRLMHHAPDYEEFVSFAAGRLLVGYVAYPGYPFLSFERDGFKFFVEGHVFSKTPEVLQNELFDLASVVLKDSGGADHVRRWVQEADGDFVVVIAGLLGEDVLVFTDALGRLPLYVFQNEHDLLIARECKFIAGARGVFAFDPLGCAQSLWIGYPLGDRTLIEGVKRGGCGFFIRATATKARVDIVSHDLMTWNFGSGPPASQPVRVLAAELVDLFGMTIRERGRQEQGSPRVMSLSGGHDSRSVAAGLRRFDGEYRAISRDIIGRSDRDWRLAEVIARELQVPWELIQVSEASAAAEVRLAWLKDGLNPVGAASMIDYLTEILSRYGRRTVYTTGDGGDKVFPDLRPWRAASTVDELLRLLIEMHASVDSRLIEEAVDLPGGSLSDDLRSRVLSYPEKDFVAKAVHFAVHERGRKWLFEGEDRNRCFMWQSSPCYALPVFRHAMNLSSNLKSNYRLYREFQKQLWPALTRIDHADAGFPIASLRFRSRTRLHSWFRSLPRPVKGLVGPLRRRPAGGRQNSGSMATEPVVSRWRQSVRLQALISESRLAALLASGTRNTLENISTLSLVSSEWEARIPNG